MLNRISKIREFKPSSQLLFQIIKNASSKVYSKTLNLPNAGSFKLSMKNIYEHEETIKRASDWIQKIIFEKMPSLNLYLNLFIILSCQNTKIYTNGKRKTGRVRISLTYTMVHPMLMETYTLVTW